MKLRVIFFWFCILSGILVGLALAESMEFGPENIKIDTNGEGKAVAAFSHWKHQQLPDLKGHCASCHHKLKGVESQEGEKPGKCGDCHKDAKKKHEKAGVLGFKDAFHKLCQECHKNQKDKPDLKKCSSCHGN